MDSHSLLCKLKMSGLVGCELDEGLNLSFVESTTTSVVVLPKDLHGLVGTGFSGLGIEEIKFNKNLKVFEPTSLSNCSKLKIVYIYPDQQSLANAIRRMYKNVKIVIRGVTN